MIATLETRIKAGQTCLICPRCGWWKAYALNVALPQKLHIDATCCPDCKGSLDSIEQRA